MMKKHSQKGSATMLAVFVLMFVVIVMGGLIPLVNTQVSLTAKNQNVLEAQYAAEAGAKRAIVGLMQNRTDWTWADGVTQQPFIDGMKKYYAVKISPSITNKNAPTTGTAYTITSTGTVNGVSKTITVNFNTPASGITAIPISSGCIGILAPPSGGDISVNHANILTNAANPPSLGYATSLGNQSMPPTYNYASYKNHASAYALHTQSIGSNLYYYDGNLTLGQNDNLSGTSGNNAVLFVNGNITFTGGGMNINNVILVATGNIVQASGSSVSFGNSVLISNSNITFNSLALLQPAILITPGTVSFTSGVHWNNDITDPATTVGSDANLVGIINTKLQAYATASGSGSSSSSSSGTTGVPYGWSN
jgi:hypothetical protein